LVDIRRGRFSEIVYDSFCMLSAVRKASYIPSAQVHRNTERTSSAVGSILAMLMATLVVIVPLWRSDLRTGGLTSNIVAFVALFTVGYIWPSIPTYVRHFSVWRL